MDIFENFKKELQEDTKIDEIYLTQKQLMLPAIKHKWVARLIEQKRKLNALNKKKKIVRAAVIASLEKEGMPPSMPKSALDRKIENSDAMQKINEEMEDIEITIEYLEKVENIFRTMTYDIKNIIDINRLETT